LKAFSFCMTGFFCLESKTKLARGSKITETFLAIHYDQND
jgi:hypothetical protein